MGIVLLLERKQKQKQNFYTRYDSGKVIKERKKSDAGGFFYQMVLAFSSFARISRECTTIFFFFF